MVNAETIAKAVEEAKKGAKKRNFRQSVDLLINLKDLDMKKPENRISEEFVLPHGRGKDTKVALMAGGELALKGKEVVDKVISKEDLDALLVAGKKGPIKALADGYDFFIAQVDMMSLVGKNLGPVFGPRGKMPKPVPLNANLKPMVERLRKTVRIRTKEAPSIQMAIGTEDMDSDKLAANVGAALQHIEGKLEKGAGNIKSVYIKATMGPRVKVEL